LVAAVSGGLRIVYELHAFGLNGARSKSILPWVGWAPDAESFHLINQSSALQSKPGGRASRPPDPPVGALTRSRNFLANFVLKRWINDFE